MDAAGLDGLSVTLTRFSGSTAMNDALPDYIGLIDDAEVGELLERLREGEPQQREVARVLSGEHSALLHPFRYERFATGDLHPVSHSPYPWS